MSLKINNTELMDLMKNFYILTGIRIALFDETYNEIFSYPHECSPYCSYMRKNPTFNNLCCRSDAVSFETCKKTRSLTMYKCHAGLIEAAAPILNNGAIIGYIMFGQVSDSSEKDEFRKTLLSMSKNYFDSVTLSELIEKVKFKPKKQLVAASKILETCISYILLKEIIKPKRIELFTSIDKYISENIGDEINVDILCRKFNISRTRLYALCDQYIPGGIAAYIRTKRMHTAMKLLCTTRMTVAEISRTVGFSDYNYFIKLFKKFYGVSTKTVRKDMLCHNPDIDRDEPLKKPDLNILPR